jgi:PI-3-kinase-related kinase SMG-1
MFYGKIIPALKEKGIKRVVSRRDWPLDVKRKVLLELMNETPKQILWQEMWCASEGFRNFNSKVKRYAGHGTFLLNTSFTLFATCSLLLGG